MSTIDEIKQQAAAVKNATQVGENTAERVGGLNKIYQGATRCSISETPFCLFIELSKKSALWNLRIYKEITRSIC